MPSLFHEVLVELFRQRPLLGPELLRICADLRLEGTSAELGSIDLSQVAPTEYRSDALIVLRDRAARPAAVVIAEVQLGIDENKRRTWPLYVSAARATFGCPVSLLVLAPLPAVARWARRPIDLGHPGFTLSPLVVSYAEVPRITEAAEARAAPELAVLSALAHRDLETADAAAAVLPALGEDLQQLYCDLILAGLTERARRTMETRMIKGYEYQSDFARRYVAQGRREGLQEGRREGLRHAILALVAVRAPGVRAEAARTLDAIAEPRLEQIILELDGVRDEAGVLAILRARAS